MKELKIFFVILFFSAELLAQQKPLIDTGMLHSWPELSPTEGSIALSNNGKYAAYVIYNRPAGQRTLVLQGLGRQWGKIIVGKTARILFFTADSRQLCWQNGDSIWLQTAGSDKYRLLGITNVISYANEAKREWIAIPATSVDSAFRLLNLITGKEKKVTSVKSHKWFDEGRRLLLVTSDDEIKVLDLKEDQEQHFTSIKDHFLFPDGKGILLLKEKRETGNGMCLQWLTFGDKSPAMIWDGKPGEQPGNYIYNKIDGQLAFSIRSSKETVAIWHYKVGQASSTLLVDDKSIGLEPGLKISGVRSFSSNGRWLFFNVRKKILSLPDELVIAPVDIWSYRDETLNPAQSVNRLNFRDYAAVTEVNSNKVQLLEQQDDERISLLPGDHIILSKGGAADRIGSWWPNSESASIWLLSLENGKRILINQSRSQGFGWGNSPNGRWVYYWDAELGHYFIVNPQTGRTINLTINLPISLTDDIGQVYSLPVGIAGWYTGDSSLLVYDDFDIWKLDPSGKKSGINITGGYGRQHGIKLRMVYGSKNVIRGNEELLLSGFDTETKYNGFFSIRLDKPGIPELLTMGPYTYYQTTVYEQSFSAGMQPLSGGKGKTKCWIVMRESSRDYPNLFISRDLKQFTPITYLQPQKAFNWISTETVSWKMYSGQINYGVLYKPENFDSTRRYPIIFNYYEKYAHRCYQFPMPGLTTDNINIPWFVSRGYLVFTPDIQFTMASKVGGMTISEAAYNAVASAAEYLSQRPYVDKNKLAIQGHSFGGHETNAIITQSSLFAAAAEVAGYSDHISAYLTLVGVPVENDHKIDHYNQRMGATPWERPDLFRRNSPVQNADKVTTPLMIVHNKKDGSVNFRQGIEMYMALRRLGKPCWLLQYDNSGHVLDDKKDALDYTIRLTQYFDHYLKGAPPPLWMTMNTLAGYKGRNNLYELDPTGNCGRDCKVCNQLNTKQISTKTK